MDARGVIYLKTLPLEVLESAHDTSFALSEPLDIVYCNSAWDRFALDNGGGPAMQGRNVLSKNLLEFVAADLRRFYAELFALARGLGQPVDHDYECSSSSTFRLFRMRIYPLAPGHGFVVLNSLRVEGPHDRRPNQANAAIYGDAAGLVHMCANCRRTRRVRDPEAWDWVPEYLDRSLPNVSHGACPMCLEYYYRPLVKQTA